MHQASSHKRTSSLVAAAGPLPGRCSSFLCRHLAWFECGVAPRTGQKVELSERSSGSLLPRSHLQSPNLALPRPAVILSPWLASGRVY